MSLLVPFLMAVLLLGVPLVPSLVVLLVAVVASLESLLLALLVALVPSPMPLLVPDGPRGGVSSGDTADGVAGVCSPPATADGRTGGSLCVTPRSRWALACPESSRPPGGAVRPLEALSGRK